MNCITCGKETKTGVHGEHGIQCHECALKHTKEWQARGLAQNFQFLFMKELKAERDNLYSLYHPSQDFFMVLIAELGRLSEAINDSDPIRAKGEIVLMAAILSAMWEDYERGKYGSIGARASE